MGRQSIGQCHQRIKLEEQPHRPVHPHVAARAHRPAELRPQQKEQKQQQK